MVHEIPGAGTAHARDSVDIHWKLYALAGVQTVITHVTRAIGSVQTARDEFPFLQGYIQQIAALGMDARADDALWQMELARVEQAHAEHLPLSALRKKAGLSWQSMMLFMCIGLIEEDARFGNVFERAHGIAGQRRATFGLLNAWWDGGNTPESARASLKNLLELGLVHAVNPDAPRLEWALQVSSPVWDALRGEPPPKGDIRFSYRAGPELPTRNELILTDALREKCARVPQLVEAGYARALVVRGPQSNGRRTLLGALAREMGQGALYIQAAERLDAAHWKEIGLLATALNAMPIFTFELAPGETAELESIAAYHGPIGIVLGNQGGIHGAHAERALTFTLGLPDANARRAHWANALDNHFELDDAEALSAQYRLTAGNVRRVAQLAQTYAALDNRHVIMQADAHAACGALNRQMLDTLATRLEPRGNWSLLAVDEYTQQELYELENRCRHRERLASALGEAFAGQLNCGVRVLFSGASGTGKTLAAQVLASALEMDVYRVDLSAVINKYIGETEKNLNQLFARAEELDVILLLDEGDALLTQRTGVQSSNDRYANLETNYLLQRLETYEGIVIVTTNAAERIDRAFQRRMDMVIEFRAPNIPERWALWQLHLPARHTIPAALLDEVAERCTLKGGQIRNAALHASLLALDDGGIVTARHLESAVQREYRQLGAVCPLKKF